MRTISRRSLLSAFGLTLPFGLGGRARGTPAQPGPVLALRVVPFEEAVRSAFADADRSSAPRREVEVGDSDLVRAGVQGSHNDRPFAGFSAGHLRIVRTASRPGPVCQGARLYVTTVDV